MTIARDCDQVQWNSKIYGPLTNIVHKKVLIPSLIHMLESIIIMNTSLYVVFKQWKHVLRLSARRKVDSEDSVSWILMATYYAHLFDDGSLYFHLQNATWMISNERIIKNTPLSTMQLYVAQHLIQKENYSRHSNGLIVLKILICWEFAYLCIYIELFEFEIQCNTFKNAFHSQWVSPSPHNFQSFNYEDIIVFILLTIQFLFIFHVNYSTTYLLPLNDFKVRSKGFIVFCILNEQDL